MVITIFKRGMEDIAGRLCEIFIPINDAYFIGKGKTIAICVLSSMDLLQAIARSEDMMERILIVGRLLSENKGIDSLVRFTIRHPELVYMIVCGKDVKGHQSGQALLSLYRNGVTTDGKIIGATGPNPVLRCLQEDVESFRKQIMIYDLIGCKDIETLKIAISSLD
jgi:tetrahydromethanopterin S-methyltransferase subunit A